MPNELVKASTVSVPVVSGKAILRKPLHHVPVVVVSNCAKLNPSPKVSTHESAR